MENENKKHAFPKKLVVCAVLIATLSAAVYLNWQYNLNNTSPELTSALNKTEKYMGDAEYVNATVSTTASNFFSKSRAEREQTRDQSLKTLKETVENPKSDEKSKEEAAAKIKAITENDKFQTNIETLVKSKGFSECLAVIGDEGINVIVKAPNGLKQEQSMQIQDIILQNTKISLENIKIIEVK